MNDKFEPGKIRGESKSKSSRVLKDLSELAAELKYQQWSFGPKDFNALIPPPTPGKSIHVVRFELDDLFIRTEVIALIYEEEGLKFCREADKRGYVKFDFFKEVKKTPFLLKWKDDKYSQAGTMKKYFFEAMANLKQDVSFWGLGDALITWTIGDIDKASCGNRAFISYCKTKWIGKELPQGNKESYEILESSTLFKNVTGFNQKTLDAFRKRKIEEDNIEEEKIDIV